MARQALDGAWRGGSALYCQHFTIPFMADPGQDDSDGDSIGGACDSAPTDPLSC